MFLLLKDGQSLSCNGIQRLFDAYATLDKWTKLIEIYEACTHIQVTNTTKYKHREVTNTTHINYRQINIDMVNYIQIQHKYDETTNP